MLPASGRFGIHKVNLPAKSHAVAVPLLLFAVLPVETPSFTAPSFHKLLSLLGRLDQETMASDFCLELSQPDREIKPLSKMENPLFLLRCYLGKVITFRCF